MFLYICKRENHLDAAAGFELLKARSEIYNVVILIGNLCRAPEVYQDHTINYTTCQYQIAANRKFHIRDIGAADVKTDSPWIKSFGGQAKQDALGSRRALPYSVEYLEGCLFPERDEEGKTGEGAAGYEASRT